MVFGTNSVNITLSNSGKNSLVAQYLETYTINRYREKENKAHHRQDSNQPTLNKLVDLLQLFRLFCSGRRGARCPSVSATGDLTPASSASTLPSAKASEAASKVARFAR